MTPAKIVFVLPSLESGGAERVLINLMNGLDRARFSPVLVNIRKDGPLLPMIAGDIPVLSLSHRGPLLLCLPMLTVTLARQKPSLVISTVTPMNFIVMATRLFLPHVHFHVREATMPSWFLTRFKNYKWLIRQMFRLCYGAADGVICPAKAMIAELKSIYGLKHDRFVWLPNPVDTAMISATISKDNGTTTAGGVNFICVGRLVYVKGYDRLIAALRDFMPDSNWTLTLVGDGPERQKLHDIVASAKLENRVYFAGHCAAPWPRVARARALLLPSRLEGLPNVVLEALACGTPVIALAEAGGVAEIEAETTPGSVTIVADIPQMLAAMEKAAASPKPPVQLPERYAMENIQKDFSAYLESDSRS